VGRPLPGALYAIRRHPFDSAPQVDAGSSSGNEEATETAGAAGLADPRGLHPNPPFPAQQQPWPGLAGRMTPRPDHGETSYVGTGRLTGRHALITGGDSGIGRAAAIAYLPAEEPDAREVVQLVRGAGRKAVALPGDTRNETFCEALVANAVQQMGGFDILVNNAGRQHSHDSILDISTEDFDWTLRTNLYAMF
jgi:hypothetical protein